MAGLIIETQPTSEPITLTMAKNFLRVTITDDDALINIMITAAREACESFCNRSFAVKGYKMVLDSFPYYTDTVMSQMAYPPSYYSLPRYSTTLWNYSQMIKLFRPPLLNVTRITYLDSMEQQFRDLTPVPYLWYPGTKYPLGALVMDVNGNVQECTVAGTSGSNPPTWNTEIGQNTVEVAPEPPTAPPAPTWVNNGPSPNQEDSSVGAFGTFIQDVVSEPGRIFPGPPGQMWPSVLYVPDAVQIHFTAGYDGVMQVMPARIQMAMLQLIAHWYENREAVMAGSMKDMPNHVSMLLWSCRSQDFQPTRG